MNVIPKDLDFNFVFMPWLILVLLIIVVGIVVLRASRPLPGPLRNVIFVASMLATMWGFFKWYPI